jgi:hypothetical protein
VAHFCQAPTKTTPFCRKTAHFSPVWNNATEDIIQSLLLLLAYTYARYAQSDCTTRSAFVLAHLLQRALASLASSHHYVPQTPLEQLDESHSQLSRSLLPERASF